MGDLEIEGACGGFPVWAAQPPDPLELAFEAPGTEPARRHATGETVGEYLTPEPGSERGARARARNGVLVRGLRIRPSLVRCERRDGELCTVAARTEASSRTRWTLVGIDAHSRLRACEALPDRTLAATYAEAGQLDAIQRVAALAPDAGREEVVRSA